MFDKLVLSTENSGGVITVSANGALSLLTTDEFRKETAVWLEANPRQIILDMRKIIQIDSAGIGALLQAISACTARGINFNITHVPSALKTVFAMSGLSNIISS